MMNDVIVREMILPEVKNNLQITWEDEDTEKRLVNIVKDGVVELNHLFGADVDYVSPGMERRLLLNYILYAWNDCLDEFEDAYRKQILRVRNKHQVEAWKNEKETV